MVNTGLLPAWLPTDVLFVLLLTLIVAVLALNKGRWWSVNMLAMDEPIMVAVGVAIAFASGLIADATGSAQWIFLVIGLGIAALGLLAVRSDRIDFDFIG